MTIRHTLAAACLSAGLVGPVLSSVAAQSSPNPDAARPVYVAEVDAMIHPVSAEFMIATLDKADADGAGLLIFVLRTPGGLVDSMQAIVARVISARTPVVVYVGPSGARAASAGFLITIAADVAAMAPGTHIGAAHPVGGLGSSLDETMSKKAASDLAAYGRSIAAQRKRNVTLVEQAITESRAFTEHEALDASPPLIDLLAASLDELVRSLNGRAVSRFQGGSVTLRTAGARVERIEMTWRQRVLSAIAHPQVAYLLFSLGTLGLTIELWNPGAVLPGVVGGLCLLLAFFAFAILPVNYAGLLLIAFGLLLLVLEIKVTSFGLLAVGGILSLIVGSMILIDSPLPELQLSVWVILPAMLALASIVMVLARLAFAAQRRRSITGTAGMIDAPGRVLTAIAPGRPGRISTHGEIWQATAAEPISEGEPVRVVGVDGLTVEVRPVRGDRH